MTEKNSQSLHGEDLFSLWSQTMTDVCSGMLKLWPPPEKVNKSKEKAAPSQGSGTAERMGSAAEVALKNWQALATAMSAPESILST